MKKVILGFAVSIMLTSVAIAADVKATTKPIVIKVSHVVKSGATKGIGAEQFKKIMESKFPGRVKVEVYHDNTLFKDREESEALELNAVNVIIPTTGKVSAFYGVKEFELFDLPFLFDKGEDITKFTQSSTGEKLLDFFNKKNKNLYAVTYWPNDFRNYIGSKFYKKPDDFKGMVARTETLGTMKMFYDVLGVKEAITLAFSDLGKALKKEGEFKVDVAGNPHSNALQSKFYESSKFLTLSNHDVNSYVFLTNRRWFNNLPDDIKVGLTDAAKQAGLFHFEVAQKNSTKELAELQKNGVKVYTWTKEEKEEFKKKAVTVHENYLKNINKEFLNEVYTIVR